jgi:tetratricopeptide (TPR) repeat protein
MASGQNPSASIPIEAVPSTSAAAAVVRSPAPAKRKELTVEDLAREIRRLDQYLVAVVLLLTFFLASFTAGNSDVWMHLASGRLIAHGQYQFGADPFSYTAGDSGQLWVNHAWLAELIAYEASEMLGGPETALAGAVLVAAKALLIVILAGLMLLICRRGPSLWIPVGFVAMAVLAMSPRLFLQPRCFSFVFLGLTLYLLERPRPAGQTWPRHYFLLPVLFALWVNLDSWFVLGPLTVALYLLGKMIQRAVSLRKVSDANHSAREIQQLAIILVVGLVACLVNPFHVRAFALPEELWALTHAKPEWFRDDLQGYLYSPIKSGYVTNPLLGLNPAGLAYYVLVVLGLVSFFAAASTWSWWRLLMWLVFALLSLTLARAIPFFAVVGGVIAALNWQDFAAQHLGVQPSLDPRRKNWSLLGRTLTLLAGLALLVLAWPGWLNARPDQARQVHRNHRVAWTIEVDPSLRAAALKLAELRADKALTDDDRGFNFSPDVANYCAWFSPQEKSFVDYRFPLFQDNLGTFNKLREALRSSPDGVVRTDTDWVSLFQERRINHVIVFQPGDTVLLMRRFWAFPKRWSMLYADGRSAIFGWIDPSDPRAAQRWQDHEVNMNELAFGPAVRREEPGAENDLESEAEKNQGVPRPLSWWTQYIAGPAPRPLAVDEAIMYLAWYEFTSVQRERSAQSAAVQAMFARWIASWAGAGNTVLQGLFNLGLARADQRQRGYFLDHAVLFDFFRRRQNPGPSPALLLAVRAARRAIAANSQDAAAYQELALAYQVMWRSQEEPSRYPPLQQLRQIQVMTALQNALTLKPEDVNLHREFATMAAQMPVQLFLDSRAPPGTTFFDIEIEQMQEVVRLTRIAGPQQVAREDGTGTREEKPEEFSKRIESFEQQVKQREKAVDLQRRRNDYEVTTANKPPLEKARRAVELGLVKQALDVLKEQVELPEDARQLAIRLYLATGEVQPLLGLESGSIGNSRNNFLLRAAVGDYANADRYLDEIVRGKDQSFLRGVLAGVREHTFQAGLHPVNLWALVQTASSYKDLANDWVLWGLLALEEGATDKAVERFRKALDVAVWPPYRAIMLTSLAASSPVEALVLETSVTRQPSYGPTVPFATRALAYAYSQLLREAGHSP